MEIIKEPLDVDFFVDPRPYTKEEEKMISDYISAFQIKAAKKESRAKSAKKKKQ